MNDEEEITGQVLQLYGIHHENESPLVTLRKAHNKFIFNEGWYTDILKSQDEHYRQMSLILNYGGRLFNLHNFEEMGIQETENPLTDKDPSFGSGFTYKVISQHSSMSNDTLEMLAS